MARETAGGTIYLALSEDLCSGILDAWLDAAPNSVWRDGSAAGVSLVRRVVSDWLVRLPGERRDIQSRRPRSDAISDMPPADLFLPFSGAVLATFHAWFGTFDAVLDPNFVQYVQASSARPQVSKSLPLVSRHEAIRGAELKVRVQGLADARLSLGVLRSLAIGDVILLEPNVSDPWVVTNTADQKVAFGFIGRKGENRAIILSGIKES